jgi:hypothetical protein
LNIHKTKTNFALFFKKVNKRQNIKCTRKEKYRFLDHQFLQDGVAGTVLNPRYIGQPWIFCLG